ncbi:MAG: hypothetical protein IT159_00990 [Bryobacterales bacterium]|nr:hypothetical protein [Bryobacterales bacterium]
MRLVWMVLSSAGIALQLLLIAGFLREGVSRYRVFFVYVVVLFLTTVTDAAVFYNEHLFSRVSRYYWLSDALRQTMIFLVVLSFVHRALEQSPRRNMLARLMWSAVFVIILASAVFTKDPRGLGFWMTSLSRNLGFLAVILNLGLWAVLIQNRAGDRTLLSVTGGMGIQMAGKAIGHSLRQISPSAWTAGNLVLVLSHLLCLYIWWQAFRPRTPAQSPATRFS